MSNKGFSFYLETCDIITLWSVLFVANAVKPSFNYFCRGCYHNQKHKLGVTRSDFKYLRHGLGVHQHIPEDCNFKQAYECLVEKRPTLFPLANLLENTLFLKLVFRGGLDLRAVRSNPTNDTTTNN